MFMNINEQTGIPNLKLVVHSVYTNNFTFAVVF